VAVLRRALETGRVAHAYAFIGSEGAGRTATALAFAGALLCEARGTAADGCGACRGCRLAAARQHPDLHLIVPTPPDRKPKPLAIRIDDVREIERRAGLRPVMGAFKVFVIDDADLMTAQTPEAFLKTLEEPPDRSVMILVLARARAVPATVLSRCQIVRFAPRPREAGPEAAEVRALVAEARAKGMTAVFARLERARPDREKAEALVDACWLWWRDVMLAHAGAPAALLSDPERAEAMAAEAAAWTMDEIVDALADCRTAREGLAVNVAPRLTLEVLMSRVALKAA
jgi:DNA polymerase-3 subunit delta'